MPQRQLTVEGTEVPQEMKDGSDSATREDGVRSSRRANTSNMAWYSSAPITKRVDEFVLKASGGTTLRLCGGMDETKAFTMG